MKSMINKQNTSRLNNSDNKVDAKQCNCRSDKNCRLNGKCCRNSVVYKASLKTGETDKFYYGSCETSFKLRYNNHNQSFKDSRKINSTELSKARNKMENCTTRNSIPMWFKNMQLMLIRKITNIPN